MANLVHVDGDADLFRMRTGFGQFLAENPCRWFVDVVDRCCNQTTGPKTDARVVIR